MTDLLQPQWGELVPFYGDNWQALPDMPYPYYVEAKEGTYQHNRTALGRALIKTYRTPSALREIGTHSGFFHFDAPPLPKELIAQVIDFFRRVYREHHTEACVLFTENATTGQRRIFVPHQRLSHGGVHSIYNPEHIAPGHLVIGTAHSHCDFDGYHSGTDEGDARRMDGLHLTTGHLMDEMPDVAAMVSFQKELFHYKDIAKVADFSDLNAAKAPQWWDQYLIFGHVTDADRQRIAPYATNEDWDRFMGRFDYNKSNKPVPVNKQYTGFRATPPPTQFRGSEDQSAFLTALGYKYDPQHRTYTYVGGSEHGMLRESVEFNNRQLYRPPQWGPEGELVMDQPRQTLAGMTDDELAEYMAKFDEKDYWEDQLGKEFIDSLFDSDLLTEDDLDSATKDMASATQEYWERVMRAKLIAAADWLNEHGHKVSLRVTPPRRQLPGQMEAFPEQKGAHV